MSYALEAMPYALSMGYALYWYLIRSALLLKYHSSAFCDAYKAIGIARRVVLAVSYLGSGFVFGHRVRQVRGLETHSRSNVLLP